MDPWRRLINRPDGVTVPRRTRLLSWVRSRQFSSAHCADDTVAHRYGHGADHLVDEGAVQLIGQHRVGFNVGNPAATSRNC